jgi:hypothetical protein
MDNKVGCTCICRAKSKENVHVASPVGEIQLKMYCNPRPYHDETGLYVKVQSGSRERGGIDHKTLESNLKVEPLVLLPRVDVRAEDQVVLAITDPDGLPEISGFEPKVCTLDI